MPLNQRLLVGFYALAAVGALFATWSQNLLFFQQAADTSGLGFIDATKANPATRSIMVDLGFLFMAVAPFMVIEARRLGVRFVWLYMIASFMVAISVTFPLFMLARELRLAPANKPDAPWSLTLIDIIGLLLVEGALIAASIHVLT